MIQNRKHDTRKGLTLVEVLVAVVLVSVAAAVVYTELIASYRILMRSRAKLEAQSLGFDRLWEEYNAPIEDLPIVANVEVETVQENSILYPHGSLRVTVIPTDVSTLPDPVDYWDIFVQVWAGTNTPVTFGGLLDDVPLVEYSVTRYRGHRVREDD